MTKEVKEAIARLRKVYKYEEGTDALDIAIRMVYQDLVHPFEADDLCAFYSAMECDESTVAKYHVAHTHKEGHDTKVQATD